jgi:hypothetical protein
MVLVRNATSAAFRFLPSLQLTFTIIKSSCKVLRKVKGYDTDSNGYLDYAEAAVMAVDVMTDDR